MSVGRDVTTSRDALNQRRLAALQQVSLASATVLDPRELAQVALEETVRILGAERAYLFLVDPDLDQLVPTLGRDAAGAELGELTGYSTTLVERVHKSRKALVVSGSEEGVALGSRSAQIHGLRSIMIAPLLFRSRLLGVVYLDSRIARGMFNEDDVDTLMAITNHVAVSLETARAAQLAVGVEVARRQRDVAETLRQALAKQSATLDPDEVMRQLLWVLTETLSGQTAALLSPDGDDGSGGGGQVRSGVRPRRQRSTRRSCRYVSGSAVAGRSATSSAARPVGWRSRSRSGATRPACCSSGRGTTPRCRRRWCSSRRPSPVRA